MTANSQYVCDLCVYVMKSTAFNGTCMNNLFICPCIVFHCYGLHFADKQTDSRLSFQKFQTYCHKCYYRLITVLCTAFMGIWCLPTTNNQQMAEKCPGKKNPKWQTILMFAIKSADSCLFLARHFYTILPQKSALFAQITRDTMTLPQQCLEYFFYIT